MKSDPATGWIAWAGNLLFTRGRKSVVAKLILFLSLVLPIVVSAIFTILTTYQDNTKDVMVRKRAIATLASTIIRERLDRLVALSISIASRPILIERVAKGQWTDAEKIIRDIPQEFHSIAGVFITDKDGTLREGAPGFRDIIGQSFASRDWYHGAAKGWHPYISHAYRRANAPQCNIVAVATPITRSSYYGDDLSVRDSSAGDVLGLLVLQIRLEIFAEWIKDIDVGSEGFLYIVDRKGHIIYHPLIDSQGELEDFSSVASVQKVINGINGVEVLFNPVVKQERLAAYEPISGYGWGLIMVQPKSVAFADRQKTLIFLIATYLVVLVLVCSLTYFVLRIFSERRLMEDGMGRLNDELNSYVARLSEANKEIEAFSYSVSHDLRAPLRVITGFSRMVCEDCADRLDDEGRRKLMIIENNAGKMGRLIDDMLALSLLGRQEKRQDVTDMTSLAGDVVEELRRSINPARSVTFTIKPLPGAVGDRGMLRQVFVNLLSNAIKFSSPRTRAVIEIGSLSAADENIYYVKDNGVGFDPSYADKLFGVFQRLHSREAFEGTGIGLAIVRRVIERHGGRVWAKGSIDGGAIFYFALPKQ